MLSNMMHCVFMLSVSTHYAIMPSVFMLSVTIFNSIMLNVFILSVSMLSVTMASFMWSVIMLNGLCLVSVY